ncbi:MAG: hypothetical protein R3F20_13550 [Planctomycetota bacterium]
MTGVDAAASFPVFAALLRERLRGGRSETLAGWIAEAEAGLVALAAEDTEAGARGEDVIRAMRRAEELLEKLARGATRGPGGR